MYEFVPEDSDFLKQVVPPFDFTNPPIDPGKLVIDLLDILYSESAVGLAANQVGLSYRMFVMYMPDTGLTRACFNPEVVSVSDATHRETEGCLSFPALWLPVKRPVRIEARYQDSTGKLVNETFENYAARCYLHETDHLNGIRFVDLVGPLTLSRAKGRRSKLFSKGIPNDHGAG